MTSGWGQMRKKGPGQISYIEADPWVLGKFLVSGLNSRRGRNPGRQELLSCGRRAYFIINCTLPARDCSRQGLGAPEYIGKL